MSGRYKITFPNGLYFVTITTVGWIDIFTRRKYKDILIESLKYCQEYKGLQVFAYIIMTNHLHLLVQAREGYSLIAALGDFKKFTAKQIIRTIQTSKEESRKEWLLYQLRSFAKQSGKDQKHLFWQPYNHPMHLYSPKMITQKLGYIHNNPVKAGIVLKPEDYIFSSASNYVNGVGVLEVEVIDFGITQGYVFLGP